MLLDFNTSDMQSYQQFLKLKKIPAYQWRGSTAIIHDQYASEFGIEKTQYIVDWEPSPRCFDYQRDITKLAIRKRKFAVFAECGLGKTIILLEFAQAARKALHGKSVLIVSPLMVISQTLDEAKRFYPSLKMEQVPASNLQDWLGSNHGAIGITNYEAIREGLQPERLGALCLDECFPAGTMVDIVKNNISTQQRIENLLPGDMIHNASGIDRVVAIKKRKVSHAVVIKAGASFTCSPNHPVFTQRGWQCAQDLEPGDSILQTAEAVRTVRDRIRAEGHIGIGAVLRSILLSEMADESGRASRESPHARDSHQNRQRQTSVVCSRKSEGRIGTEADCGIESNDESRSEDESLIDSETHEAQTFRAWGQRDWFDGSAEDFAGCVGVELESGVCCVAGPSDSGISNALQARLSERRNQSRYRSGWVLASQPEDEGRKEGCEAGFIRVESLEVLEQGHPELERLRDADGELYFYDIEAARHPSFSVNGLLVHNSSLLKSHYGAWGTRLIELGRGLEWKLALTGTPAPNDRIEYANHAVFCDHFRTVNEFLARYFVNRGETQNRWEIKPHALRPFYRDLSHWCIFLSNPAVYGWKDNCDTVPPIHVHVDHIDLTVEQRKEVQTITGGLFVNGIGGIGQRGKLSQLAKGKSNGEQIATEKPAFIRRLVDSWPDESTLIWCRYNAEQESMERVFPEADSISGDTPIEDRIRIINDFKGGCVKILISKPRVLGFGLNLQIATRQVWSGLQDSWEEFHQGVKRSNRIGSTRPLNVHIPVTEIEVPMIQTVLAKADRIEHDTKEQERLFKSLRLEAVM